MTKEYLIYAKAKKGSWRKNIKTFKPVNIGYGLHITNEVSASVWYSREGALKVSKSLEKEFPDIKFVVRRYIDKR